MKSFATKILASPLKIVAIVLGILRGLRIAIQYRANPFDATTLIGESSFGHKITSLDYFARLFQGNKLLVFWYPLSATNPYLLKYYSEYLSYATIEPLGLWKNGSAFPALELKGLRIGLSLGFGLGRYRGFLPDVTLLYKCLNKQNSKMTVYGVWEGEAAVPFETFYSHDTLLEQFPLRGLGSGIPEWVDFEKLLSKAVGLPVTKFVGLLLRRDAGLHKTLHDQLRDAGSPAAYESAVAYLSSKGHTVLIAGVDTWPEVEKLPNVHLASRLPLDAALVNFAMLTRSQFLVCQHSGPVHLANIAGVPLVIADFLPLWQGSAGRRDLFVPKRFFDPKGARTVPLREIFTKFPRLFFGDYGQLKELELRGADPGDIREAVIEMEQELASPGRSEADSELVACRETYFRLLPKPSLHHLRKNRVSRSILLREFRP